MLITFSALFLHQTVERPMNTRAFVPLLLLIGLQGLDVLLHVVTGQVEMIRIASNIIIASGAIVAALLPARISRLVLIMETAAYLALNIVFLAMNGWINPETGSPRLPLIIFIAGTLVLAVLLGRRLKTDPFNG